MKFTRCICVLEKLSSQQQNISCHVLYVIFISLNSQSYFRWSKYSIDFSCYWKKKLLWKRIQKVESIEEEFWRPFFWLGFGKFNALPDKWCSIFLANRSMKVITADCTSFKRLSLSATLIFIGRPHDFLPSDGQKEMNWSSLVIEA